jgi:nitrogen fixation/metabolism regulation signal transduction histidine kinase
MVRRFTRDHGGELDLANREPRGARVTLRLPCARLALSDASADEGVQTHA